MRATARAQPNIALIKYWGKRDSQRNLPAVGSISVTLDELYTTMRVELDGALNHDELQVNGRDARSMLPRVSLCLDTVLGAERLRALGHVAGEAMERRPLAKGRLQVAGVHGRQLGSVDRAHAAAQLERAAEGFLDADLLVEHEADEQGHGVGGEQGVGLWIAGVVQRSGGRSVHGGRVP